jgi:predicted transcriptional regulator
MLQANVSYADNVDGDGSPRLEGNRALIYDYIAKHPGTHLREIRKNLGIGMGDLQYHLYILEKARLINSVRRGLYKFVFPSGVFGDRQTAILSVLSIETEREILLFLSERPVATQQEICKFARLSPPTITWHMRRLENDGIVERRKIGKFVSYKLNCDAEEVKKFIQNYHPAFLETWSSRMTNTILELSIGAMPPAVENTESVEHQEDEERKEENKDDGD